MTQQAHDVGSVADLCDGELHQVTVDGSDILLYRDQDGVHAVGATCPHAGAPLATGLRSGSHIICPWHKATFCLRTGRLLEPPAVDPLPFYPARIDAGRVFVTPQPEPPTIPNPAIANPATASPATPDTTRPHSASPTVSSPTAAPDPRRFVIVGAGAAGALAAQTLREEDFGGEIVMLDQHNRVPYDRTLLSKYALSGAPAGEKSPLQSQSFYQDHAIDRRTANVTHIDTQARRITCAHGEIITYDTVLLATGAVPVRPGIPGATLGNVFTLRTIADANAILAQAERSRRAVILGTSFIGMEVAASLRERGLEVVVAGQETAPFAKRLGEAVGNAFVSLHQRKGVTFRLGRQISALTGDQDVQGVTLDNNEHLPADLVVIGFGVTPATSFTADLPRTPDGGIIVDANLQAAPHVFAAGDIARFPLRGNGPTIRVEHWRVAEQQGRAAARNMLGRPQPYTAVPVFWTIQYMKRLDYIGHAESWDDIIIHGDLSKPEFLAYYVKDGTVTAAAGLDRDDDTAALVALFSQRTDWTAAELTDSPATVFRLAAQAPTG